MKADSGFFADVARFESESNTSVLAAWPAAATPVTRDERIAQLFSGAARSLALLDRDSIVLALPAVLVRPEEREHGLSSDRQRSRGQVEDVRAQTRIASVGVMLRIPFVDTPMHLCRRKEHDAQGFVPGNAACFVIESPAENLSYTFLHQVALHGLWRLIEHLTDANRSAQLDVFGMCPHQRTSRARWLATEEFQGWNIGGIPDLLWEQVAVSDGGIFHHGKEGLCFVTMSGS